jgi:hypothetical protein
MRTTEPTTVTQGEQAEWKRSFCGFPATEWTLEYRFRGLGPGADVAGVADGTAFITTLLASQTLPFVVGQYRWQAWVTEAADATNKEMIAEGGLTVEQGFVSGETGDIDLRTTAKKILDSIDAAILAAGEGDMTDILEYEITTPAGNRHVKRTTRADLLALRDKYAGIVSRENLAERVKNGGPFAKSVKVRMFER